MLNSPLYWRTFNCLQSQGIVKYQALLVSAKFCYLVALLWKIRTLLCAVTRFFLKSTTVEGVEFSIVLKDFQLSTVTGYSEVQSPAGFSQILLPCRLIVKNKNPIMRSYTIFSKKHNGGGWWILHCIEGLSTVYSRRVQWRTKPCWFLQNLANL